MKAAVSFMLLTAIFVPNALCSGSESDFKFISRTSNRLGYGVFYDHWSFNAGYKSGNNEIHMSQSGELSGSMNGCSLQLYEIGEERYPAFYEFSVRTGELEGLVSTFGGAADYLADLPLDFIAIC